MKIRPLDTVCPRSSDHFYVVTYYIKWVNTSWTNSKIADPVNASKCHQPEYGVQRAGSLLQRNGGVQQVLVDERMRQLEIHALEFSKAKL